MQRLGWDPEYFLGSAITLTLIKSPQTAFQVFLSMRLFFLIETGVNLDSFVENHLLAQLFDESGESFRDKRRDLFEILPNKKRHRQFGVIFFICRVMYPASVIRCKT